MAMESFSWTDSLRAAVGTCIPCFTSCGQSSSSDSENENGCEGQTGRQTHFDELEGLLGDSDDADTMSLHSNIGRGQQRRRKKRRAQRNIQLFGFNLFGRPPIQLPESDDENTLNHDHSRRRRLSLGQNSSTHSSSSVSAFDEDAAPLDPADISRLTAQDAAARAQDIERVRQAEEQRMKEERDEREERRRKRRERKELKRVAEAIANGATINMDGEQFEGFQGSGERAPPTYLPAMHSPTYSPSAPIEDFGPYVGGTNPSASDDSADADADFGGEAYVRKPRSHGSDSSRSQTRSRSSATQSNPGSAQGYNHYYLSKVSPLPSPIADGHTQPSLASNFPTTAAPEKKRKKKSKSVAHLASPPTSQSASLPSLDSPTATTPTLSEPHVVVGGEHNLTPLCNSGFAPMQNDKFPIIGFGGMRREDSAGSGAFLANRGHL